jgi:hypothetical protein
VDFDPKPDHRLHKLAELDGRIEVLEAGTGQSFKIHS